MRYLQALSVALLLAAPTRASSQAEATKVTAIKLNSCGGSWAYTTNYPVPHAAGIARFVLTMQDKGGNEIDITFIPQVSVMEVISAVQTGSTWSVSLQAPQADQDGFFHLITPSQIYYLEVDLNIAAGSTNLANFTVNNTNAKC